MLISLVHVCCSLYVCFSYLFFVSLLDWSSRWVYLTAFESVSHLSYLCSEPWEVPAAGGLVRVWGGQQQWESVSRSAAQWRVAVFGWSAYREQEQRLELTDTCESPYKPQQTQSGHHKQLQSMRNIYKHITSLFYCFSLPINTNTKKT